ncbi:hypothetical protein AAHE18_13G366100 [Arachis hypogaea]
MDFMFILGCRPCLQVLLVVAAAAAVAADLSSFFQSCSPSFQFVVVVAAAAAADLSSLFESRRPCDQQCSLFLFVVVIGFCSC